VEDPWSDQNVNNPAFQNGVPMQLPPASQAANEPPLVVYVLHHTNPSGLTKLKDCPG